MTEFVGDSNRALRQLLADWRSAGVTALPHVAPPEQIEQSQNAGRNSGSVTSDEVAPRDIALVKGASPGGDVRPVGAAQSAHVATNNTEISTEVAVSASTLTLDERIQQLQSLQETVSQCVRCKELAEARTQTVFGVGNPDATVMFVGEAPGADEDAQGEPFVGRAGQLLNKIIEACGWQREDLYICNILRCRPPGNRNPSPEEAANCREYLDGQIRLVDPDYIVCWGSVAAHNLLDETTPIGKLREKWFKYGRAKVLCTYHPSYLLRNPAAKKPVWEDMKLLLAEMGIEPPAPA